ncbi:hypothetical protein IJG72_04535 [bacterium]|nr:hypothetical protein [bacterium]
MECPKCGYEIDKNTLVCPNCKKVLKLICPICKTINETNICTKCGYTIVSKCHKCGKINQTIKGHCAKCGFDTNVSVILRESNIEEFACVSIDFPNLQDIKQVLGTAQLYTKFKEKLSKLITDYVKSIGVKRQVIDNTIVIRFNRDYTYTSSAKNALKASVDLLNLIAKLNYKLDKLKNFKLVCNIAILKRNAYATNDDYKSGINIQLLYDAVDTKKLTSSLQLIADSSIYNVVGKSYKFSSIGTTHVKKQDIFLYELNLENYIKVEPDEDDNDDSTEIKIPDIIQTQQEILENDESIYDIDGILFEEINCQFKKEMNQGLSSKITQQLMSKPKNIIVVKGKKKYQPRILDIINKIEENNIFSKICKVTCYDEMKYKPYGMFNDLISGFFNFSTTGKDKELNNYTGLNILENSDVLKNLINITPIENTHPENVKDIIFNGVESFIKKLKKTLIIIEDIDKIDDSSLEILQNLFKKLDEYDVSYVITADNEFSLHRYAHFLLSKMEYLEIRLKPTPIKEFIEANSTLCKKILDTFYFQKISKNTKGSQLYFMNALLHLLDLGILKIEKGSLILEKPKTVVFPSTLDELVQKRLLYLKTSNNPAFKFFTYMLFIGPQLDFNSIKYFNIENSNTCIEHLISKEFISNKNNLIQIQDYNLYSSNVLKILSAEEKKSIANFLITYCFKESSAHPILAKLYNLIGNSKNEFVQWENLSNISLALGDFNAYLNCNMRFLKLLDNNMSENAVKSIEEYKMEVYENITGFLYKHTSDKIANIYQSVFDNLNESMSSKKVINLCNKILQNCLNSGNYTHALQLINTMLSRMDSTEINPSSKDFNINAFTISLIKVQVLFNVGDYEDCIVLGDEIFNILKNSNLDTIKPKSLTEKDFIEQLTNTAEYVLFSRVLQLKKDTPNFCEIIESVLPKIPDSFKLFVEIDKLLRGYPLSKNLKVNIGQNDLFGECLLKIVQAFSNESANAEEFAAKIYHAKVAAKEKKLNKIELFCDLLIGHSYFELEKYQKAAVIYNSVLEESTNSGFKDITKLALYSMAELSANTGEVSSAYILVSNTLIELEQQNNANIFIIFMFKILQTKILKLQNKDNDSNLCFEQVKQISKKYNIKM